MIIQIVQIVFVICLLLVGLYFSRPKISKTDQFFNKLKSAMKKKTPVFDYKISDLMDSEMGHIKNVLEFNKIKYVFSHKNQDPIISIMVLGHTNLDVNYYAFSSKPKRIKKMFQKPTNVISVDFKARKRV